MPKHSNHFLLVCLISLLSILLHGYTFSGSDQTHYVPLVIKNTFSQLYSRDYVADFPEGKLTFFVPLMSPLISAEADIEWVYLILYIATHLLIVHQLFKLSLKVTGSSVTAYVATIFLSLPHFVAGTTLTTLDIAWLPRYLAYGLLLIFFNKLLSKQLISAAVFLSIAGLLHPFTAVITLCLYLGHIFREKNKSAHLIPLLIAATPLAWFTTVRLFSFESLPLTMAPAWLQIISTRMSYNFMLKWQLPAWLLVALTLTIIMAYLATATSTKLHYWLKISTITAAIVSLLHLIGADLLHFTAITQLQLLRIWLFPTLFSYIAVAVWVTGLWQKSPIGKVLAIFICGIIITNFGRSQTLGLIEWPHSQNRDWDQVQKWAQAHTPENSLFITPPQRVGFRVLSHRSVVTEIKDGSSGLYSYDFARTWQERMADIHPLGNKTTTEIITLANKYQANYLVTFTTDLSHPKLKQVFRTKTLVVYKL